MNRLLNKKAFTLAEMMVVLCILSLVTAAFLPVITTRSKATPGSIWKWAANNTDIYFGTGNTQGAAIGTNGLGGNNTRLLLNTVAGQNAIFFQQNGTNTGRLTLTGTGTDPENSLGLGNVVLPATFDYAVAIGGTDGTNVTEASRLDSTAIGAGARARTSNWTTAIGASSQASGTNATALGVSAQATGLNSISIGQGSTASASHSTVIGQNATANNDQSIAIGGSSTNLSLNTVASGTYSIAIGNGSHATATCATALGYEASAPAVSSTALGYGTSIGTGADFSTAVGFGAAIAANSTASIAMGCGAQAIGDQSIAMGFHSEAQTNFSSSIGYIAVASGASATAMGYTATASGDNSMSMGFTSTASSTNSTAIGYQSKATEVDALAIGYWAQALASGSSPTQPAGGTPAAPLAIGYYAIANYTATTAVGYNSQALKPYCTAFGYKAIANDSYGYYGDGAPATSGYSTAIGYNSQTTNYQALALGFSSLGSGAYTTAIGNYTVASNTQCTGVGYNCHATGQRSTAMGTGTYASGSYGLALGYSCYAKGEESISIGGINGRDNTVGGTCSISIGWSTNDAYADGIYTVGDNSVTIGPYSRSSGANAIAIGNSTRATASNSIAIGSSASVGTANTIQLGGAGMTDIWGPATTHWTSDRRLKNVGSKYNDGLDIIRKLQPYNYTMKADEKKKPRIGIIAQDLQKVLPNAVSKNDNGYLAIRQDDILYSMLNSVKQLDKMVQGLIKDVKSILVRLQLVEDKIIALINVDKINSEKIDNIYKELNQLKKENKVLKAEVLRLKKGS